MSAIAFSDRDRNPPSAPPRGLGEISVSDSPSGAVRIPDGVIALYKEAKISFFYAEERERISDLPSLVEFRDALDHLIEAVAHASNTTHEDSHLALVIEHLGMVVAESIQRIAGLAFLEVQAFDRRRSLRVLYRHLPTREEVARDSRKFADLMEMGRAAKGKQTAEGWIAASQSFREAYDCATILRDQQREAPFRARKTIVALVPVALVVLGAVLGAVLTVLLEAWYLPKP